jgi:hypothetical protein
VFYGLPQEILQKKSFFIVEISDGNNWLFIGSHSFKNKATGYFSRAKWILFFLMSLIYHLKKYSQNHG